MKALFKIVFFLLCVHITNAQTPVGTPTINSPGWAKYRWVQADSGQILPVRDTNWLPRFPTAVLWQNAGVDTAIWVFPGQRPWVKIAGSNEIKVIGAEDGVYLDTTDKKIKLGVDLSDPALQRGIIRTDIPKYIAQGDMLNPKYVSIVFDSSQTLSFNAYNIFNNNLKSAFVGVEQHNGYTSAYMSSNGAAAASRQRISLNSGVVGDTGLSVMLVEDLANQRGLVYAGDYEANFLSRSLVTKQYVDARPTGINNTNVGVGFRILNDPSAQTLRTIYNSNTILWDSTSNVNGLTPKVDTSVIATKYNLSQIGSGVSNQVTYWTGVSSIGGDNTYLFDPSIKHVSLNTLRIPSTSAVNNTGMIFRNGVRWLHTYSPPNSDSNNIWIGDNAGNLTMTSSGGLSSFQASKNIGIGGNVMKSLTTGYFNTIIGYGSGESITSAAGTIIVGNNALRFLDTAHDNNAFGDNSLYNTMGKENVGYGYRSGYHNTLGSRNVYVGYASGVRSTTTDYNTFVGAETSVDTTTGQKNNVTVLGAGAIATASNQVTLGNASVTETQTFGTIYARRLGANIRLFQDGTTNNDGLVATGGGNTIVLSNYNISRGLRINSNGVTEFIGTSAIDVNVGTTAQRPSSPSSGFFRFNSDSIYYEGYNGTGWELFASRNWVRSQGFAIGNTIYTGSGTLATNVTVTQGGNNISFLANSGGLFNVSTNDATTNTIVEVLKVSHNTIGVNAIGSGVSIGLYNENATGSNVRTSAIQSIMSNVTSGSESASFIMNTVAGGVLTERLRLTSNGFVGISKNNPAVTIDMDATDAIKLTYGTTVQRPSGVAGYFRGNSDSLSTEYYDGTAWRAMATREWVRENIAGGSNTIYTGDGTATNRTVTVSGFVNFIGGEIKIGSATDRGLYSFQNTGSVYQAGVIVQAESGATYPYLSGINGTVKNWFVGTFKDNVITQGLRIDTLNNVWTGTNAYTVPNYSSGASFITTGAFINAAESYDSWTVVNNNSSIPNNAYFKTILIDASSNNITITIPTVASSSSGSGGTGSVGIVYLFKRIDNTVNTVTIQAQGGDLIDGAASITLAAQWESKKIQACGSNRWLIIGN